MAVPRGIMINVRFFTYDKHDKSCMLRPSVFSLYELSTLLVANESNKAGTLANTYIYTHRKFPTKRGRNLVLQNGAQTHQSERMPPLTKYPATEEALEGG